MSSRSRSFKFDNVTKQISIAGQVVSDGSTSTPTVSGNLSANTQSNITAVGTLSSLTVTGNISAANYNYANGVSILSEIIANAGAQSGAIVTANTAMKGYVDAINSTLTSNAAVQAGAIASTNTAITTANTAMKGYVDAINSTLTANAGSLSGQIVTANTALKGYIDGQITNLVNGAPATLDTLNELATALGNDANLSVTLTNKITNTESNISTANTAMKGYVDAINSTLTSNAGSLSGQIVTANTAMKGYVDAINSTLTANLGAVSGSLASLTANAAVQAGAIADLVANAGAQSGAIVAANTAMQGYVDGQISSVTSAWQANAGAQSASIATLTSNAAVQAGDIATLFANAGAQAGAIVSSNTAMKGYVDGQILSLGIGGGSNYGNSNVAAYLPTYTGNIKANSYVEGANLSSFGPGYMTINSYWGNIKLPGDNSSVYGDYQFGTYQFTIGPSVYSNFSVTDDINLSEPIKLVFANNTLFSANSSYFAFKNNSSGNPIKVSTLGNLYVGGGILTDNYYYANGTPISFGGGSGTTYSDSNVAAYLATNQYAVIGNITTANTAMKGYVDAVTTAWTANAGAQAGLIADLTSNAAVQAGAIASTNTAITTANTAMKGYVDGQITSLVNGAPSTLDTLNELATALGNDVNLSATLTSYIGNVNANIGTANLAMKGYVDNGLSSLSSNKISASGSNVTVTTSYVNVAVAGTNVASFSSAGLRGNAVLTGLTVSGSTAVDLNSASTDFNLGLKVGRYITGQSGSKLSITNQSNGLYLEAGSNAVLDMAGTTVNLGQSTGTGTFTVQMSVTDIQGTQTSTSTTTGALKVAGGVGIVGNLNVGANLAVAANATIGGTLMQYGKLTVDVPTASTNTTSGALVVTGGAGIGGNLYAGNVQGTNLTGTLLTGAQPNITSLGGATSVGQNSSTVLKGTLDSSSGSQTNITSVGTLTSLAVTANSSTFTDTVSISTTNKVLRIVNGSSEIWMSAKLGPGSYNPLVGANDSAIVFGSGTQNQGNLVIAPWSTATFGMKFVANANTIQIPGILSINSNNNTVAIANGGTNGVGNIGASGQGFNTVFAKASSAQYADLAEVYVGDRNYIPGTVVVFGGISEVTVSLTSHDPSVAGVVSTNPAYLMNDTVEGVAVALQGRVPCRVLGPVVKGDRVVSSDVRGVAERLDMAKYQPGCIIGKVLESVPEGEIATIEVVVGRN